MSKLKEVLNRLTETAGTDTIKWFIDNPNPDDNKVHALATDQGKEPAALETEIYRLATVGAYILHKSWDIEAFDKDQLEAGIKVEMEHLPKDGDEATKRFIASYIAAAHITELPDYYTRLAKMEGETK